MPGEIIRQVTALTERFEVLIAHIVLDVIEVRNRENDARPCNGMRFVILGTAILTVISSAHKTNAL